jgi:hypothetical protein
VRIETDAAREFHYNGGRTLDDLQRQLIAPFVEIPSGFNLANFRELQRSTQEISAGLSDPRFASLSHLAFSSQIIFIGTQRFRAWEARWEIVRGGIEYLKNHRELGMTTGRSICSPGDAS